MKDKRRLNRVQWNNPSMEGAEPVESSPTPWAMAPGEEGSSAWEVAPNATQWTAETGQNSFSQWRSPFPEAAPTSWNVAPEENNSFSEAAEAPQAEEAYDAEYDPQAEGMYDEGMYDEEFYEDEEAFLEEQRQIEEAERRTLRDALLILVALYIICGIAPLFMGLFVPLKVFFWLEIGGWAIIIAWLIIGVRRPLMRWFRERARQRAEQESEQQQNVSEG